MRMFFALMIVAMGAILFEGRASAQETKKPQALVEKAKKMPAVGDKIEALRNYTDELCSLRLAGASKEKLAVVENQRDKLVTELLAQMAEIEKQQAALLTIQGDVAKKIGSVVQIDKNVQSMIVKNQRKLKDIEGELIDATR